MRQAAFALLLVFGSPSVARAASTHEVVLSLEHADCAECGERATKAVRAVHGVKGATYDLSKAEIHVEAKDGVADSDLVAAAMSIGEKFDVAVGAGHGSYVPFPEIPAGLDVVRLSSGGQDVASLDPVPGKVTVFDFYADWCEPCRGVDQHMIEVLKAHPDVAYRKLDAVDWDSPLTKHWLKKVAGLPYLVVYGKDGKQVGTLVGAKKLDALDGLLAKGGAR